MKETLRRIRTPKQNNSNRLSVGATIAALLGGIALGAFAKWLDNLALDSTIWWHRTIETLDLGNVFSGFPVWLVLALAIAVYSRTPKLAALRTGLFFLGMCAAYHLYTIWFSGFNPSRYMTIWYGITLLSPGLAVLCWYGKGKTLPSVLIDVCILAVLAVFCFSIGWFYFSFHGAVNALLFLAAAAVLYSSPKQTLLALPGSLALAFVLSSLLPIHF